MHSFEDRDRALKHDKGYIGKRYVCVKVVSQSFADDFAARDEEKVTELVSSVSKKTYNTALMM